MPNAADVALFNRALDPALTVPSDLAAIPAPRLAVVGLHDSRLDVDALEALAKADPSWQIVLIGPVKPGQVDTGRLRRTIRTSTCSERSLSRSYPGYLKGVAVALIPYRLNELTRNIFPLKLYEYLAAGLPVVAAALPELAPFAGVISLADESQRYPALGPGGARGRFLRGPSRSSGLCRRRDLGSARRGDIARSSKTCSLAHGATAAGGTVAGTVTE